MQFIRKIREINKTIYIAIPADLAKFMDLDPNKNVVIEESKDEAGKTILKIWRSEDGDRAEPTEE